MPLEIWGTTYTVSIIQYAKTISRLPKLVAGPGALKGNDDSPFRQSSPSFFRMIESSEVDRLFFSSVGTARCYAIIHNLNQVCLWAESNEIDTRELQRLRKGFEYFISGIVDIIFHETGIDFSITQYTATLRKTPVVLMNALKARPKNEDEIFRRLNLNDALRIIMINPIEKLFRPLCAEMLRLGKRLDQMIAIEVSKEPDATQKSEYHTHLTKQHHTLGTDFFTVEKLAMALQECKLGIESTSGFFAQRQASNSHTSANSQGSSPNSQRSAPRMLFSSASSSTPASSNTPASSSTPSSLDPASHDASFPFSGLSESTDSVKRPRDDDHDAPSGQPPTTLSHYLPPGFWHK